MTGSYTLCLSTDAISTVALRQNYLVLSHVLEKRCTMYATKERSFLCVFGTELLGIITSAIRQDYLVLSHVLEQRCTMYATAELRFHFLLGTKLSDIFLSTGSTRFDTL